MPMEELLCTQEQVSSSSIDKICCCKVKSSTPCSYKRSSTGLMAAVLGSRMAGSTSRVLNASLDQATFWSESMNVLWWTRGRSRSFKPFVASHVGEIQTATDPRQWQYVPTKKNPADLLMRGLKLSELTKNENWRTGTDFSGHEESEWPVNKVVIEQRLRK